MRLIFRCGSTLGLDHCLRQQQMFQRLFHRIFGSVRISIRLPTGGDMFVYGRVQFPGIVSESSGVFFDFHLLKLKGRCQLPSLNSAAGDAPNSLR